MTEARTECVGRAEVSLSLLWGTGHGGGRASNSVRCAWDMEPWVLVDPSTIDLSGSPNAA